MDYKLIIKGKQDAIDLMKSYINAINKLHIEGEGIENEDNVVWILRNVDEKDVTLLKELSKKTPSVSYQLGKFNDDKK